MTTHCSGCGAPLDGEGRCSARCFPVHKKACGHPKGQCRCCGQAVAMAMEGSPLLKGAYQMMLELRTGHPHRCDQFNARALEVTTERCKACGRGIRWTESPQGKFVPIDIDGAPHHRTCPHGNLFRAKKGAKS